MGKCMFRLSDMMPNSWFYKLKDMSRAAAATPTTKHPSKRLLNNPRPKPTPSPTTKKQQSNSNSNSFPQPNQLYIPNRPSYYISPNRPQAEHLPTSPAHPKASDTHFPLSPAPRKSKKKHRHRRSSNSNSNSNKNKPVGCPTNSSSSSSASAYSDIIIDMKRLPPIHTKPAKRKDVELDSKQIMLRRAQQGLHRIRVRPSTPKIEVKRISRKVGSSRRLAESFVIVKRSADPMRDFKESMVEMIVENDIRGSKDLEELLACYLSLNSDEYHDLIVKVFEEIWIYLTDVGATDCLIVK